MAVADVGFACVAVAAGVYVEFTAEALFGR
jgi:hypothetical protein